MFSITQPLHRAIQQKPNQLATKYLDRHHTWIQLYDRVAKAATGFTKLGINDNDHMAILALNCDRYYELLFAIPWAGAAMVPLNNRWIVKENEYAINQSAPKILIVDDAYVNQATELKTLCPCLEHLIYIGENETPDGFVNYEDLIADSETMVDRQGASNGLLGIFYTGGTTGFPKGVMLEHRGLYMNALMMAQEAKLEEGEVNCNIAPMFHLADLTICLAATDVLATQTFVQVVTPDGVMKALKEDSVSLALMVPTIMTILAQHPGFNSDDLPALRTIIYGASPISEGLLTKLLLLLPNVRFNQAYGQTELAPVATFLSHEYHTLKGPKAGKLKSAGRACTIADIKIVDKEGNDCKVGDVGEVYAQTAAQMIGYWQDEKQTKDTIVDGWVKTGDAGYLDEDGFLFLVDRVKDMIVSGGENVYTAEVENAISLHPACIQSAVFGIPDEKWGEAVHAYIQVPADSTVTEQEIIDHCHEHIAGYKCPRSIEFTHEPLPLSGAGKILKRQLREKHWK